MQLRLPGSIDQTIAELKNLVSLGSNVLSTWPAGNGPSSLAMAKDAYLRWVENATAIINNYVLDDDLVHELRAHGYWRIYDMAMGDARPFPMVEHEIRLQQRRLNAAVAYLERLKPFIEREGGILMPDTSAFVEGRDFTEFDWTSLGVQPLPVRLVVPVLVIEELEKVKSFDRTRGHIARRVLKELRQVLRTVGPGEAAVLRKNVTIEAFVDEDDHRRLENHDGEIIDQAVQVQALTGRDVTIVSLDLPMELRTLLRGVQVATMPAKDEYKFPAQS